MSKKEIIKTKSAPAAVGPYSQAVKANGFLFCSGQLPIIAHNGEILAGSVADQTDLCLINLKAVIEASGSSMDKVVKCTVFLKDMSKFDEMNKVYARYFSDNPPARAAIEVSELPKCVDVEIEAIALI